MGSTKRAGIAVAVATFVGPASVAAQGPTTTPVTIADPIAESELGDAQYYRLFSRSFRVSAGARF